MNPMSHFRILSSVLTAAALTLGAFPQISRAESLPSTESTPQVLAQATSTESTGNLSVTGTGQVNAPATQAVIMLSFYPVYPTDYSDPSASQTPQVLPSDLKTMVDAVTASGVTAANVKAYPDFTSPGSVRVRVIVDQPNQARVEQIISNVNTTVVKGNRYTASSAYVGYLVGDCQTLENQARQAAMTDAQNRASALATVAGRQLSDIVSLSESVSWGSNYGGITCPSSTDATVYADAYSMPAYDPAVPAVVKVLYSLGITYNMR